jgi:hypothetical protein
MEKIQRTTNAPIHSDQMTDFPWQGMPADPYRFRDAKKGLPQAVLLSVGLALPVLFWWMGWKILAVVAISIFATVTTVSLASPAIKLRIEGFLLKFSLWVAKGVSWLLLAPIYFILFTTLRFFLFCAGMDPLRLRMKSAATYWEPCDDTQRNVKSVRRMFCSEVPKVLTARALLTGVLFAGFLILTIGEIALRLMGYANPVLYTHDADVCYLPQPNQHVKSLRGEVVLNEYSMRRAGSITREKPANVYRILLLGDSTLYGGEYLTNGQTYASLLEKELNRMVPAGKAVEVLPMGVNSWGPYQKLGYVKKFGTFGADQVIVCMPVGDAYRYAFSMEHLPYARRQPVFGWEMVALHLSWRYRNRMQLPEGWATIETQEHFQKGVGVYAELTDLLKRSAADVSYELLPQGADGLHAETSVQVARELKMFRDGLAGTGVRIDYPAGLFSDQGKADEIYHSLKDQAHLGVRGHQLYATYLSEKIGKSHPQFIKFLNP